MQNGRIEIYTKPFCVYCQRAKELLRIKGLDFIEHDITRDEQRAAELSRRAPLGDVPKVFIDDRLIGGCGELFALDERGELDPLVTLLLPSGGWSG